MRIFLLTLLGCLSLVPMSESTPGKSLYVKIPKGMYYKDTIVQPSNLQEIRCMIHINHSAQLFGKELAMKKRRAYLVLEALKEIKTYRVEYRILHLGKLVVFTHSRYKRFDKSKKHTLEYKLLETRLNHYNLQLNIVSYQLCTGRYGSLKSNRSLMILLRALKQDYRSKHKIKSEFKKEKNLKDKVIDISQEI